MDVHDQLVREMAEADAPPIGSLVTDAITGGARARRRRSGLIGGLVVAVTMVAVAGVVGGLHLRPSAATGPQTQAGAPAPAPSNPAAIKTQPPADQPLVVVGPHVIALLEHLVAPHGHFTEVDDGLAGFLYDDGHGAATISAYLSDQPADYGPGVTGMGCPTASPGFTCETRHLAGGVVARIVLAGPYPGCTEPKCSIQDRRVEIKRPDGTYVVVDASNGPEGHGRPATRPATILSTAQLLAIATNPHWTLTM